MKKDGGWKSSEDSSRRIMLGLPWQFSAEGASLIHGQGTRIPHALKRVSPGATIEEMHLHGNEDPLHFNQSINTLFKFENHYFQLNMAGCTHTLICVSSN